MEILFEFIEEIVLELGIELVRNKKINKWIRYPVGLLMGMFFSVIFVGIAVLGFSILKEQPVVSLFLWGFDLVIVIALFKKLIKRI